MTKKLIDGEERIDVGIPGVFSFPNYGGALTQFALYNVIKSFGLSVLMIERPESASIKPSLGQLMFRQCPYKEDEISKLYPNLRSMEELNDICKMFIIGSDQLFNNYLYNSFGRFVTLDWARNYKKKIGYACSFGFDYVFGSEFDRAEIQRCLLKFDYFSVREESGVELMKKEFGIETINVLDPVFLCDKSIFYNVSKNSRELNVEKPFIFAYILDLNEKILKIINKLSNRLNIKVKLVCDAEKNEQFFGEANIESIQDVKVEEWLRLLFESDFVITDSFHGTTFSIIGKKDFISIENSTRGKTRFKSIANILDLKDRLIDLECIPDIDQILENRINYDVVENLLENEIVKSKSWLGNAIFNNNVKKPLLDYDLINVRMNYIEDSIHGRIDNLEKEIKELREIILEMKNIAK